MSNTVIQVDQLSKSYGNHQVLHDLSLSIPTGSITALLGANGAGKTTLIQHLLGRLLPQKGHLECPACRCPSTSVQTWLTWLAKNR